jgi:methylenetetrahydrofolate dehydrogenase (NADP+) / methenyltetrahydrofolate cyclohydrolase / formyltetrahydrofolate synthetase
VELKKTSTENLEALGKGSSNLVRHIENSNNFGIPVVVVVNKFSSDTQNEFDLLKKISIESGAFDCVLSDHWSQGGKGAIEAAKSIVKACDETPKLKLSYDISKSIKEKIETVCLNIYRAKGVEYSEKAEIAIKRIEKLGLDKLPICMAKTQYSFSHDPDLKGAPTDFVIPIMDLSVSSGAGLIVVFVGSISRMPGLTTLPAYYNIDVDFDDNEKIVGLF